MPFIPKAKQVLWTRHAQAKMAFYKLSEQRVVRVMHSPKRIEEGVAPRTVAMMQPASIKTMAGGSTFANKIDETVKKETWSQEIWVMVQDLGKQRKIISAWRYPGMTKPRSEDSLDLLRREYREFLAGKK
jgi:hypothetical protein